MRQFQNQAEASFYDYMCSRRQHKKSTIWQYILRCRTIMSMDLLQNENLDPLISAYETGRYKDINATSHKAFSCALKRLREYQIHKGIVVA